jgi:hypothetical protein
MIRAPKSRKGDKTEEKDYDGHKTMRNDHSPHALRQKECTQHKPSDENRDNAAPP